MPTQSRHRMHFRWYYPLPRDQWDIYLCFHCLAEGVARWWKRESQLSQEYRSITWPVHPDDAPDMLCDRCYQNQCGGVTNTNRREWVEDMGLPTILGRTSNHIKRRLP
jgi:hypothetical protein